MATFPIRLDIFRTAIPMRRFEHAAARRDTAQAVVARMTFDDGSVTWGETLPRQYVTGETLDSVVRDIEETLWPWCCAERPAGELPLRTADGRPIPAAACAIDLCDPGGLRRQRRSGRRAIAARVSGVLGSAEPARTLRRLRLMWLYGLKDFKLKLGFGEAVDGENLRLVHRLIGRPVAAGRASLRVDVNGGWDAASTPQRVAELARQGVCAVEQPVRCGAAELVELARACNGGAGGVPLIADESLVTEDDAQTLLAEPRRIWWNIRISKNGGLQAAGRLLALAAEHRVSAVVGCMVGESGILSAAQRRLLADREAAMVRLVEGNYGRFLLSDDLTRPSPRFGYGGRLTLLSGGGLGVQVLEDKVLRYGRLVRTLEA